MQNDPWAAFNPQAQPQQAQPVIRPLTPPAPEKPEKPRIVKMGDTLGIVDDSGGFTPTYTAPPKPAATPAGQKNEQAMRAKTGNLDALVRQIQRVEDIYNDGFKDEAYGLFSSIAEYLPSDDASQLNAAGAGLAEQGLAAFRVPGQGSQSDTELRQFVEANKPSNTDRDVAIEEKLLQLKSRVDATRQAMGMEAVNWDRTDASTLNAPAGENLAASNNGYETIDDPALAGVRGAYLERLASGQTPGQILKWLEGAGVPIDGALRRSVAEQYSFRRKNPNVPLGNYDTGVLDDKIVPLSGAEQLLNDAAQSAPGAYLMRSANALTANNLDSIVGATGGNAERTRIALDDAASSSPIAALAGDVSGGVLGALTGEAGLARLGMGSGVGRALLADTGYGAATGAGGADDGNRLAGAAQGAAAGLIGSGIGQGAAKALGTAVAPTGGNLDQLYASGVRPTPGQRLVNAGDGKGVAGLVGRTVNAAEEGLSSVPIVGSAIRGAREQARDQFQVGAFNEALKDIGLKLPKEMKPGTAPHAFTQKAFDRAYDKARSGLRLVADEQLQNNVMEIGQQASTLSEASARRFDTIIADKVIRPASNTPVLDGAAYKKMQSELGKIVRGIRKSQSGDGELADVLEELQSALDSAARRHSSKKAVKALDAADRGYAKFVRIEQAAAARGGESGTFTPTQFDRSIQANSNRVRSREYLRGDALMQDYAQQGMSLVDRLPNSGSADRIAVGAAGAGGLGWMEPNALLALGGVGALYAPGARNVVAGSMAPTENATMKAVGEWLRQQSRIAGAVGASGALSGTQSRGGQ
jgi:hypothetical protein